MLRILVHNWWLLLLRGGFALIFALYVFIAHAVGQTWVLQPLALVSVVEFFGIFAMGAGIITVVAAIHSYGRDRDWWLLLLDGAGASIAGLIAVAVPSLTFAALVQLIALWASLVGVSELLMARKLRRHLTDEWFLAMAGAGSLVFAGTLFAGETFQAEALFLWLGAYALFSAFTMLALSMRLWKVKKLAHLEAAHAASLHVSSGG